MSTTVGLLGTKIGMTQVFDEDGNSVPVTVVQAGPCPVVQIKTKESDGYNAVQIGYGEQKEHRVPKPVLGHLRKAGVGPVATIQEFRTDTPSDFEPGQTLTVEKFEGIEKVDVIGTTKGRGFQGAADRAARGHQRRAGPGGPGGGPQRDPHDAGRHGPRRRGGLSPR